MAYEPQVIKTISLTLIRHAEVVNHGAFYGSTDIACEPQFLSLLKPINIKFDKILVSPKLRTQETARKLFPLDTQFILEPRAQEYDFGILEGLQFSNYTPKERVILDNFYANPYTHPIPNSEPIAVFENRIKELLYTILCQNEDGSNIALVTHGGVISQILADLFACSFLKILTTMPCKQGQATIIKFWVLKDLSPEKFNSPNTYGGTIMSFNTIL